MPKKKAIKSKNEEKVNKSIKLETILKSKQKMLYISNKQKVIAKLLIKKIKLIIIIL